MAEKLKLLSGMQQKKLDCLGARFRSVMTQSLTATLSLAVCVDGIAYVSEHTADWVREVRELLAEVGELMGSVATPDLTDRRATERAEDERMIETLLQDRPFKCCTTQRERLNRAMRVLFPLKSFGEFNPFDQQRLQGIIDDAYARYRAKKQAEREDAQKRKRRREP